MLFYDVDPQELKRRSKGTNPNPVLNALREFILSGKHMARVSDDYYNNNNDLRRAIQQCIEDNHLPIHVFMKYGRTYIEREY